MTPQQIFPLVNLIAMVAWIALAGLPRQRWVAKTIAGWAVPAVLAVVYAALIVSN